LFGRFTAYDLAIRALAFDRSTNPIDLSEPTIACLGIETTAQKPVARGLPAEI
jgi:hypothetical protein